MALLTLLLALSLPSLSLSPDTPVRDTLSVFVYYDLAESVITPESDHYLSGLKEYLSGEDVVSVCVSGWCSPEGTADYNRDLSLKRARMAAGEIAFRYGYAADEVAGRGVDWDGLLRLLGEESGASGDAGELYRILADSGMGTMEQRKAAAMRLLGGKPWREAGEKFFPLLRRADINIVYFRRDVTLEEFIESKDSVSSVPVTAAGMEEVAVEVPADTVITGMVLCEPVEEPVPVEDVRPFGGGSFVLYTNLAYDVALVPNIGTVMHLGKGWALDARWGYMWLQNDPKHFYWRMYGGEMALRKYFRKPSDAARGPWRSLTGHYLGLYGQLFTYDFEFGARGQMGGDPTMNIFKNPQYGFGLEYGYVFRLGRHFNLDVGIGAGYVGGSYHEYDPYEGGNYIWRSTYRRNWFGPARVNIALQWLIGAAGKEKGGDK